MKNRMLLTVAVAGGLFLSNGVALAADKSTECSKAGTPAMVEGQVTNVDMSQGKLTIRSLDGSIHEFQATKETIADYKVGDPIKAKLRMGPPCD